MSVLKFSLNPKLEVANPKGIERAARDQAVAADAAVGYVSDGVWITIRNAELS